LLYAVPDDAPLHVVFVAGWLNQNGYDPDVFDAAVQFVTAAFHQQYFGTQA